MVDIQAHYQSAEMETFLKESGADVKKEHSLGCYFYYGLIPCYGKVTVLPDQVRLDIYPYWIEHDIGNGTGKIISKLFKRDD